MNRLNCSSISIRFGILIGLLSPAANVPAQIAVVDNFDQYASPIVVTTTGYTNGYNIYFGGASGPKDFKAIFGFDYSTVTFPTTIPPAPQGLADIDRARHVCCG